MRALSFSLLLNDLLKGFTEISLSLSRSDSVTRRLFRRRTKQKAKKNLFDSEDNDEEEEEEEPSASRWLCMLGSCVL